MIRTEIGALAVRPIRENEYEVVVTREHGDADFSDEVRFLFDTQIGLHGALEILNVAYSARYDSLTASEMRERISAKAIEVGLDEETMIHWFTDLIGRDMVYEGSGDFARVDDFEVFWYNGEGVKFNVEVHHV